jgi:radical SAM-linked protein
MLNSIRIKFIRGDEVKYISHLDLMKVFDRALRRSNISIAYSQGYNPHPQMVFGLPLSVGVTSNSEYADFEFPTCMQPDEFMERLNKQLPGGFRIVDAKVKLTKDNIMASIAGASYDVLVSASEKTGIDVLTEKIKEFLAKDVIIIKKESKKGIRDMDIKPMIYSLDIKEADKDIRYENLFIVTMLVSAGSVANLKPELLIFALDEELDKKIKIIEINRTGLYISKGGRIINPLQAEAL